MFETTEDSSNNFSNSIFLLWVHEKYLTDTSKFMTLHLVDFNNPQIPGMHVHMHCLL